MLTRLLNRIPKRKKVVEPEGLLFAVTLPGQPPVFLRAKNQVEVRASVRSAYGLSRLPDGTKVERA